jgi:hypothetical protein
MDVHPGKKENQQARREHPEAGILNVECEMWNLKLRAERRFEI